MIALSMLMLLALVPAFLLADEEAAPAPIAGVPEPITLIPGDGMNLKIVDHITPYFVVVKVDPPVHNWFAGTLTNLPTDKEVTIGLSMEGMDTSGNKANVSKWEGLRPVMTYADPMKYETYEWYQKDEHGNWISGDPLKQGDDKFAGTGKIPIQSVVPNEVAEQFLSPDGKYWQGWREIDGVEVVKELNIFRIKLKFTSSTATIAMRIPFTYTYLQQFIERLKKTNKITVNVDEIGQTMGNHKQQVIRIDHSDRNIPIQERRSILIIAREHANEPASSWVLYGSLLKAFDEKFTNDNINWIFIPIEDPDGSINSIYEQFTDDFIKPDTNHREVTQLARYLLDYIYKENTIDMSISLHNVETNECENVFCPFMDVIHEKSIIDFNNIFFRRIELTGYRPAAPKAYWAKGQMVSRLYGWCAVNLGSIPLSYEVNDRYPSRRLSLYELQNIGRILSESISEFQSSGEGKKWHNHAVKLINTKSLDRRAYFEREYHNEHTLTNQNILIDAY